jgi:type I restriction enzyme S subunit
MLDMEAIKTFSIDKSDWQKVKFGDVVFEPKESVKDPISEGIEHVVGLEHIDSEDIHLHRSASIEESTTFTKKFSKKDVLFGRRRAYLKKAAQANFEGICSGDITVMRARDNLLLPELLPYIVNNDKFFDYAIEHSAGGLSPRVKFKDLANYEITLPNKEVQKYFLELLTAVQHNLLCCSDLLKKEVKLLKSFVEDVIHGRFMNEEGIQDSTIGSIPVGWRIVEFNEVVVVTDGAHHTPVYTESGVPFLRVTDVQSEKINLDNVKFVSPEEHKQLVKRCRPEKGDILYSKNGTIGISKIVDWDWEFSTFVSLALLKVRDKNILDINYLKLLLDSLHIKKEIHRRSKQGTVTNLHLEEIRLFRLPLPPLLKQVEIAEKVNAINASIIHSDKALIHCLNLRTSLSNKVF